MTEREERAVDRSPEDRAGRSAEGEVEVGATPEQVWRALTEATELERWFPLEARVSPGEGGSIWMSWGNEHEGSSAIRVWDPPRHLQITWGFEGAPGQVTDYWLEGRSGGTRLRVVTSGFPADASWDDLVEGTRLGWRFELTSLRHYLERHEGQHRAATYIRRRVSLSREEAWERVTAPDAVQLDALAVRVLDRTPPWQFVAVLADPPDALMRLTIDPTHDDPGLRDVTVWISAWGSSAPALVETAQAWSRRLTRLFPEATPLEAQAL